MWLKLTIFLELPELSSQNWTKVSYNCCSVGQKGLGGSTRTWIAIVKGCQKLFLYLREEKGSDFELGEIFFVMKYIHDDYIKLSTVLKLKYHNLQ